MGCGCGGRKNEYEITYRAPNLPPGGGRTKKVASEVAARAEVTKYPGATFKKIIPAG